MFSYCPGGMGGSECVAVDISVSPRIHNKPPVIFDSGSHKPGPFCLYLTVLDGFFFSGFFSWTHLKSLACTTSSANTFHSFMWSFQTFHMAPPFNAYRFCWKRQWTMFSYSPSQCHSQSSLTSSFGYLFSLKRPITLDKCLLGIA